MKVHKWKRWYVVANRIEAAFYAEGRDEEFHFVERLENADGRLTEKELDSDKPGRGFSSSSGTVHHSLDRRSHRHENVAKKFAHQIAGMLDSNRQKGTYKDLVLVAEPHFLGLLRAELTSPTRELVSHEVGHDYARASDSELEAQIRAAMDSK